MFLESVLNKNNELIDTAFLLHQKGMVMPDTYLIDLDRLIDNATLIKKKADQEGIKLFFMLKQLGRNPYLAKELIRLGYDGAVVVDFKEAEVMMNHQIPIGNVGHLVQIPDQMVSRIVDYNPFVITVYTLEKIKTINQAAAQLNKIQNILIRINSPGDTIYSGQTAGFMIADLPKIVKAIKQYTHVKIVGVTSFPCYQYQLKTNRIEKTNNLTTVLQAVERLAAEGIDVEIINTPSTTSVATLELMKQDGGNCGEPGHGLSGTTPDQLHHDLAETPCVVYVSEISHNYMDYAYCFGGGHYRRSHVKRALIGTDRQTAKQVNVIPPADDSIDYHLGLDTQATVGETVIMAFRFQIFVTRSDVIIVKGIHRGQPEIIGVYDSHGNVKWEKDLSLSY